MKIKYKDWNPKHKAMMIVAQANEIISEYQSAGYILTLRQLYYQFVSRDVIENTERSYKNLGEVITRARLAGMISWEAIEDRNREHHSYYYEEDTSVPVKNLPYHIRFDRWARQDHYVEVWVEKESLGSIIARACKPYQVPYMSCKGYLSASEAWRAGQRFKEKIEQGKNCILIHLGDHDPSGIDMTRDNADRLSMFSEEHVDVQRIALNMDQIDQYSPPPNPTKFTDSRAADYIKKYGYSSWELDALEPQTIEDLIENKITNYIDQDRWDGVGYEEEDMRDTLTKLYDNWEEIKGNLK